MEVDATIQDESVEDEGDYIPNMKLAVSDDEDGGANDSGGFKISTTTKSSKNRENKISEIGGNKRKYLYDLREPVGKEDEGVLAFEEETGKPIWGTFEDATEKEKLVEAECVAAPPKKSRPSIESKVLPEKNTTSPSTSVVEAKPASPETRQKSPLAKVSPIAQVSPVATVNPPAPVTPLVNKPKLPQDDFYKKPFGFGWKREVVLRANPEISKDKADIYYIAPTGKKMRSKTEISPHLEGDLTIEHFCFVKEPLGASPDVEIVRSAKPTNRGVSETNNSATSTSSGKRVSKPKAPKGASPPPQGWTPTRALKNSSSLNSTANSAITGSTATASPKSTPKSNKGRKVGNQQPCTMQCALAMGMIPQLQCIKCLCLYHHECVGLERKDNQYRLVMDANEGHYAGNREDYICQSCIPAAEILTLKENQLAPKIPDMQILLAALSQPPPPPPPPPQVFASASTVPQLIPIHKNPTDENKSILPEAPISKPSINFPEPTDGDLPQSIAVIKGKKYVVVKKPIIQRPTAPVAEINSIDASAENESIVSNNRTKRNNSINSNRKQQNASASVASVGLTTTEAAALQSSPTGNNVAPIKESSISSAAASLSFASNFFANVSVGYGAILHIFKYLKIHERPRAASVCKIWNLVAKDRSLWQTVRMKNSKVSNWAGFTAALRRGETKHLDLRKLLVSSTKVEETWSEFSKHIGTVHSLEQIDLCRCSAQVIESIFITNPNLTILNALAINDKNLNLTNIDNLSNLQELRIRTIDICTLQGDLSPLRTLKNLRHLSLPSVRELGTKAIEVIGELNNLISLELGECNDFDVSFTVDVLPKLSNLERLRLEIGQEQCRTVDILDSVAKLEKLTQLEIVNFDIKPGFDDKLAQCTNIRKLLIIPTYISQSATTNNIVLNAVLKLKDTLDVFTWGVTIELLRVTALYVDQCEDSTQKERHHFDECIPVLKPVPGSAAAEAMEEDLDSSDNAVPQIEILPLDKVEQILKDNLFTTKFTIVKVSYQYTWKQQLVE